MEQSLVSIHITADTVRYFLLESLRVFAADRLAERSSGGSTSRPCWRGGTATTIATRSCKREPNPSVPPDSSC